MGCSGVNQDCIPNHVQFQDVPPPAPKPAQTVAVPPERRLTDTVAKGKGGRPQGLAEFKRSLAGSKQPARSSAQTARELTRTLDSHQPQVAGHSTTGTVLHVGEGALEVAHLALEIAGASTAAMGAGLLAVPLFVASFVKGLRDAHIEGDRRVLRHAIAEGAARTLTDLCYPGRMGDGYVAAGIDGFRNAKRLGNRQGDPVKAYVTGATVIHEALKGRSPAEIQAVKRALIAQMPGYQRALQANDHPEVFRRALMEYLNTDLSRRRVGH
jgi:hypothetical protein